MKIPGKDEMKIYGNSSPIPFAALYQEDAKDSVTSFCPDTSRGSSVLLF